MVEYEQIVGPYEFEELANLFMIEVVEASKDFPNLLVEVENKTLSDLESNSWAIQKSASLKKEEMNFRAFVRGIEMDINSVNEASILIAIHGREKRDIDKFDGPEGDFKHFLSIVYAFR